MHSDGELESCPRGETELRLVHRSMRDRRHGHRRAVRQCHGSGIVARSPRNHLLLEQPCWMKIQPRLVCRQQRDVIHFVRCLVDPSCRGNKMPFPVIQVGSPHNGGSRIPDSKGRDILDQG